MGDGSHPITFFYIPFFLLLLVFSPAPSLSNIFYSFFASRVYFLNVFISTKKLSRRLISTIVCTIYTHFDNFSNYIYNGRDEGWKKIITINLMNESETIILIDLTNRLANTLILWTKTKLPACNISVSEDLLDGVLQKYFLIYWKKWFQGKFKLYMY